MSAASFRSVVAAVGLGQLLAWGSSYYLLATLARPMAAALDLPGVWVYASFSAALVVAALLGPWAGAQMDRHGGRRVLLASNLLFAASLALLVVAQDRYTLTLGWLAMGVAMPMGLYDAAFSTVVGIYGAQARRAIVGVTLIAGFASSVSWPLTAFVEAHWGWRAACALWALLHLTLGPGLHAGFVPAGVPVRTMHAAATADGPSAAPSPRTLWLLAAVFTASGFVFASMAAHLPRVLEAAGCTPATAVAAAAIVGVAQVVARVAEASWLKRLHPLLTARLSMALHPLGATLLGLFGAPLAFVFTALHGAGIGIMTIVKGTLPLALFGPAGFGRRAGLLEAPARLAQAAAPIVFGVWLDGWGATALWWSAAIAAGGWAGLLLLRLPR
ncbi:MFS transporter [Fontimonas sp. SYSU GA230001]|uniref:MFS transporter n=1 Tax=Fontimonas sp. SYSU GA230001 TaxID=3142450 RepID=UPI0032B34663